MRLGRSADGNDNGAVRQNQGKSLTNPQPWAAASGAMIGMAGQDSDRAIDLLGKHDAGEAVRQGHTAEREHLIGLG